MLYLFKLKKIEKIINIKITLLIFSYLSTCF